MTGRRYIAYGSNLNRAQMALRCPDAKVVGTGEIKDYELLFRGNRNGAVATVEPKKGESVPVLIWEISPRDEFNLDRYEGFRTGQDARRFQKTQKVLNHDEMAQPPYG